MKSKNSKEINWELVEAFCYTGSFIEQQKEDSRNETNQIIFELCQQKREDILIGLHYVLSGRYQEIEELF